MFTSYSHSSCAAYKAIVTNLDLFCVRVAMGDVRTKLFDASRGIPACPVPSLARRKRTCPIHPSTPPSPQDVCLRLPDSVVRITYVRGVVGDVVVLVFTLLSCSQVLMYHQTHTHTHTHRHTHAHTHTHARTHARLSAWRCGPSVCRRRWSS